MKSEASKKLIAQIELCQAESNESSYQDIVYTTFSKIENILDIFLMTKSVTGNSSTIDCDLFEEIDCADALIGAISTVLDKLADDREELFISNLGIFLVILMNPYLQYPEHQQIIIPRVCTLLTNLSTKERLEFQSITNDSIKATGLTDDSKKLKSLMVLVKSSKEISEKLKSRQAAHFQTVLAVLQMFINVKVLTREGDEGGVPAFKDKEIVLAAKVLEIFYILNEISKFVPYYDFYNETIEGTIDMREDYPRWKGQEGFSFCDVPFLLGTSAKAEILKVECLVNMRHELQDSFFRALFIGVNSPYLQIEVRRSFAIRDTLFQLEGKTKHDLRKQLRVSFVGEEGIDEGGVQKEFFQIIVKDMFDPSYGMFSQHEDSRLYWFTNDQSNDQQSLIEYNLIGRLIGLSIYNGVVLDINFPLALYKKLLNFPLTLQDLKEYDPMLGRGLEQLLEYEGDVSEFHRFFQVEVCSTSGERAVCDLMEDGGNIPVDNSNRKEFVKLYINFCFNTNVEKQFKQFLDGFNHVMDGSALSLFRAEELNEMVCGSPELDFLALEEKTQYDGYEKTDKIIIQFWEIVHEMADEEKKKLLFFTTGSDRVPVGGLSKLQFVIAKNGADSDRLPTSHTCYNVLLLSEYNGKEKLKDRLMKALENSNCGFFLN